MRPCRGRAAVELSDCAPTSLRSRSDDRLNFVFLAVESAAAAAAAETGVVVALLSRDDNTERAGPDEEENAGKECLLLRLSRSMDERTSSVSSVAVVVEAMDAEEDEPLLLLEAVKGRSRAFIQDDD